MSVPGVCRGARGADGGVSSPPMPVGHAEQAAQGARGTRGPAGPKAPVAGPCGPSASIRRYRPRSATSRRGSTGPIRRSGAGPFLLETAVPQHRNIRVVVVATGLEPALVDGLAARRHHARHRAAGRLRMIRNGVLDPNPVAGVPEVRAQGLQGLMDVVLHPRFAENRWVYLVLSQAVPVPGATTPQGARSSRARRCWPAAPGTARALDRRARHLRSGATRHRIARASALRATACCT